jgi:prolyl 4-hydroxylase
VTRRDLYGTKIFVVEDFLDEKECASFIARSESMNYEIATVAGTVETSVRDNDRVIFDDPRLAEDLYPRARPFLPAEVHQHRLVGFNERFRFYRYGPGQTFKPHRDGAYVRFKEHEESHLTFMLYLSEVAEGGETNFFLDMQDAFTRRPFLFVQPKRGMALVFEHDIWHEGAPVVNGLKYVLRTDVMYGRKPA